VARINVFVLVVQTMLIGSLKLTIGLVIIDTYKGKEFLSWIIDQCDQIINFNQIYVFSDEKFTNKGNWYKIPPLKSIGDYSDLVLKVLPFIIDSEHIIIVQWDGFIVDGGKWSNEFLNYDYIGAPWEGHNPSYEIGNGGFSLRSQRLLQQLKNSSLVTYFKQPDLAEDVLICKVYKSALEFEGIKFAPKSVAARFSYEWGGEARAPFGFHGPINLALFTPENVLTRFSEDIISRMKHPGVLIQFIRNLQMLSKNEALNCFIELINRDHATLGKINHYSATLTALKKP
jgi:hypothetical protein